MGAKFFVLLNQWGQIVRWNCSPANLHDTVFHCEIEDFQEKMIVLADTGFHAKEGDPTNLKICSRGQWNERMLSETTFSLFEATLDLKKIDRRLRQTLCAHLAYVAAIYNICINWTGQVQLSLVDFAL